MVTPHARDKAVNLIANRDKLRGKIAEVTASMQEEEREIVEQVQDIQQSVDTADTEISVADAELEAVKQHIKKLEDDLSLSRARVVGIVEVIAQTVLYREQRAKLLKDTKQTIEENRGKPSSYQRHLTALERDLEKIERRLQLHLARNPGADTEEAQEKFTVGGISGQIIPEQKNLMDVVDKELANA